MTPRSRLSGRRLSGAVFRAALTAVGLAAALPVTAQVAAPVPDPGVPQVRGVPFVTNRNETGLPSPGDAYGDERSGVSAGWCDITERPLRLLEKVREAAPFYIPEELLRVGDVRKAPLEAVLEELEQTTGDRPPLLYTHGFYIAFEKGCRRATAFQENAGLSGQMLWFSWPSDGAVLNYTHDEADLYWSVHDLADTIGTMAARFGPGRVNVAGHSLGARGMALALYELAGRQTEVQLGQVALLAPDMDFDLLRRMLPRIRPIVAGLTVYVAERDWPLALSAQLHGYPRLGEAGNPVELLEGVEVIDLSALPVRSSSGHLYHIYNAEVGEDLAQLFNDGARAADRRNLAPLGENSWTLLPEN
ncbi:alpha/beta hydrolase [Pseudooceanicola nanhaiensis]|uniref:alpha/beta hydrolase n=1 Tax=Pseudooceanicola nanhaiensis TaxID=375761 RepID=UPI001CD7C0A8|nr:alpha/beta hydrolase [Pseudooceanicola nanhaiensis]MCA0922594.1 alpha/beta hydrolase [Pseudooceanicola nanhaiensis]